MAHHKTITKYATNVIILTLVALTVSYVIFGLVAVSFVLSSPPTETGNDVTTTRSTQSRRLLLRSSREIPNTVNAIDTRPLQKLQKQFPVHVRDGDDDENENDDVFENIAHPGILFSSGIERIKVLLPEKAKLLSDTVSVPKFWNPPEFGEKGIRAFLGDNGNRFLTRDESRLMGSTDPISGQETIFVSIASYRDVECTATIESIFARARYPTRVRVAVVDQIDESEDQPCAKPTTSCNLDPHQALCQYAHLIDVYQAPAFLMVGPVFARHVAHRMYRGEFYALQVDAHVRFVQDWDQDIVHQWQSTNNEMAVLSTYLTGIDGSIDDKTHDSLRRERNILCMLQYDGSGVQRRLTLKSPTKQQEPSMHGTPLLHPFWSAGFSFSRGHFVTQVPYDQYLPMLFQGEEAAIAIRGFTYGYDFYAPERSVAFHIYAIKSNVNRKSRHKFWENETLFKGALDKSVARLAAITGMLGPSVKRQRQRKESDHEVMDKDKYGLGHVRSKEKYFDTFGIHPKSESVESHLCSFVQKKMHLLFTDFLRDDGIGIDYNKIDFQFQDTMMKEDSVV